MALLHVKRVCLMTQQVPCAVWKTMEWPFVMIMPPNSGSGSHVDLHVVVWIKALLMWQTSSVQHSETILSMALGV